MALENKIVSVFGSSRLLPDDPDYEEALYNLAVLDEKRSPQRSIELLERAIQIDPDYAIAHQALGRLYQRARDLVRAEYHFRRSLEIDPADYWSNMYMANLLGVLGRNEEAERTYRLAISLHPENNSRNRNVCSLP